jgi:predicted AlkP superfamily pyrophosphatase or phosphodiesterase
MFQSGNAFLLRLLVSLLFLCPVFKEAYSKPPGNKRPKLVVRVVIEQMRYEMLLRYWDRFEEDAGFKRLANKGVSCKNTKLNYALTERAPGFATLTTGSSPSTHGIIADYWYNRLSEEKEFCIDGSDSKLIGADDLKEGYGPSKLLTGTLGDELKMLDNRSKVFSVSLNPVSAVLGSGNISDGAFWFDDKTGNWVSSSYYMDTLPSWAKKFNKKGLQDTYMERQWETLMPDSTYKHSLSDENESEEGFLLIYKNKFPYNLSVLKNKSRTYKYLKYTPFGNTYTKDFAHSLIMNESLGKDAHTDLLTISFAASSYVNDIFGPRSLEMEDLFLRLDSQLEHLLSFLEESIGKNEFLLVLTSDRGCADPYEYRDDLNLPARNFKPKQGISLMRSYLDIVLDNEDWIKSYTKRQLYLDHGLIDQHGYGHSKVQETVANFMVKKSGISYAVKSSTLQEGDFSEGINAKLQNSYHPKRSGDVFIGLEAGSHEQPVNSGSSYNYHAHIPLIWYGKGINSGTIMREVNLRDVAPTISMLIDIPLPEASNGKPIRELLKIENENFDKD